MGLRSILNISNADVSGVFNKLFNLADRKQFKKYETTHFCEVRSLAAFVDVSSDSDQIVFHETTIFILDEVFLYKILNFKIETTMLSEIRM